MVQIRAIWSKASYNQTSQSMLTRSVGFFIISKCTYCVLAVTKAEEEKGNEGKSNKPQLYVIL